MTADLVAFLNARLDEDEWLARHAFSDHNSASPNWSEPTTGVVGTGGPGIDDLIAIGDGPIARHIARHDPARVLAEVDAKRRILAEAGDAFIQFGSAASLPLWVVQVLALPYAAHPDYRPEWSPDA